MGCRKIGGNYTTMCNILQSKKVKRLEPTRKGQELGLKGTGDGKFEPLVPPPPPNNDTDQWGHTRQRRKRQVGEEDSGKKTVFVR